MNDNSAPEAQCLLAPRFSVGKRISHIYSGVPYGTAQGHFFYRGH